MQQTMYYALVPSSVNVHPHMYNSSYYLRHPDEHGQFLHIMNSSGLVSNSYVMDSSGSLGDFISGGMTSLANGARSAAKGIKKRGQNAYDAYIDRQAKHDEGYLWLTRAQCLTEMCQKMMQDKNNTFRVQSWKNGQGEQKPFIIQNILAKLRLFMLAHEEFRRNNVIPPPNKISCTYNPLEYKFETDLPFCKQSMQNPEFRQILQKYSEKLQEPVKQSIQDQTGQTEQDKNTSNEINVDDKLDEINECLKTMINFINFVNRKSEEHEKTMVTDEYNRKVHQSVQY